MSGGGYNNKISIVCPIYNGEKFLRECFDSVIAQSYNNWEVVVVNDGSTDGSQNICDEYANKDDRFKIYNIDNHGVAYARNYALSKCKGNYCFFLDCDDIIPQGTLEYLINIAEKMDADMIAGEPSSFVDKPKFIGGDVRVYEYCGGREIYDNVIFDIGELKPMNRQNEKRKINNGHVGCLYKTKIIQENDVRFLHTKTGEDLYFSIKYYMHCNKVVLTSRNTYFIRMNPYSVTHGYIKNYYDDVTTCYTEFGALYDSFPEEYREKAKEGLDAWHYKRCSLAIEKELSFGKKEMSKNLKRISKDKRFRELYKNRKKLGAHKPTTRWMKNALFCTMHKMIYLPVGMAKLYHLIKKR